MRREPSPGPLPGFSPRTPRSPSNYRQPCRSGFPRARSALSRQVPPARAPNAGPRRIPGSAPLAWLLSPGSPRLGAGSGNSSSSSSGGRSWGRRSAGGRRGDAVRGSAIGLWVRWARRRAALLRGMRESHGLTASRGAGAGAGAGARAGAEPGRREAGAACRP